MYVLSKLFTYIFLPPGIFVIILFLAGIYAKKAKTLFFISALVLWALSTKFVANYLLYPLESNYKSDNITPAAVVLLGGGTNSNDVFKALPDAFKREVYAILLSKATKLPLIFSGGGELKTKEAENAKKDIELILKICNCNIKAYFENKSLNTSQNARFTAKLFEKLSLPKKIYLVTSAYHMKRAMLLFRNQGFYINPKPVGFYYNHEYSFWDVLPQMGNLNRSYKAIHEYFGILFFKIRQLL